MLTQQLFSVYDVKAEAYLPPFHCPNQAVATREFERLVNTEGHQFHLYPDDYVLFHLGEFDTQSGTITTKAAPISLGVGITYLKPSNQIALPLQED